MPHCTGVAEHARMRFASFLFLLLSALNACGGQVQTPDKPDAAPPIHRPSADGGPPSSPPSGTQPSGTTQTGTCDGVAVDLSTNQDHCGACGNACQPMERCSGGTCSFLGCYPNLAVCDGICRSLGDAKTCGSCDVACASTQVCSLRRCVDACAPGLATCDGTCVDLARDPYNCGACGSSCGDASCVNGVCTDTCPASGNGGTGGSGWKSCVAGCRDTTSDPLHCGACGNECAPGSACVKGSCVAL